MDTTVNSNPYDTWISYDKRLNPTTMFQGGKRLGSLTFHACVRACMRACTCVIYAMSQLAHIYSWEEAIDHILVVGVTPRLRNTSATNANFFRKLVAKGYANISKIHTRPYTIQNWFFICSFDQNHNKCMQLFLQNHENRNRSLYQTHENLPMVCPQYRKYTMCFPDIY